MPICPDCRQSYPDGREHTCQARPRPTDSPPVDKVGRAVFGTIVGLGVNAVAFASLFVTGFDEMAELFGVYQVLWLFPTALLLKRPSRPGVAIAGGLTLLLWGACIAVFSGPH